MWRFVKDLWVVLKWLRLLVPQIKEINRNLNTVQQRIADQDAILRRVARQQTELRELFQPSLKVVNR